MRKALLLAALAMVPSVAMGQNTTCFRAPPMRYSHEPTVPYTIHYVDRAELRKYCNQGAFAYAATPQACALIDTREIYIPNDVKGLVLACLLKHEKAHLNGWAWNHPIR